MLDKNEVDEMIKKAQQQMAEQGKPVPSFETIHADLMKHDTNKDGVISKDEFVNFLISQMEKN